METTNVEITSFADTYKIVAAWLSCYDNFDDGEMHNFTPCEMDILWILVKDRTDDRSDELKHEMLYEWVPCSSLKTI